MTPALCLALAFAAPSSAAPKLGPEWEHIKSAESAMKDELFLKAESDLKKALETNPDEPKSYEDLALVHIVFDELAPARKNVSKAIEISKRKSAKFKPGSSGKKAWAKYLAQLHSTLTEIAILEAEKVLRPALLGSGEKPKPAEVDKALGRVRTTYQQVKGYGSFKSQVDDELIAKAIDALAKAPAKKAEAEDEAGDEEPAAPAAAAKPAVEAEPAEAEEGEDLVEEGAGAEAEDEAAAPAPAAPAKKAEAKVASPFDEEPASSAEPEAAKHAGHAPAKAAPAPAPAAEEEIDPFGETGE